jgi:DNA-binding transcriptional LysR family regulator
VSQPALSKQIGMLERQLGARLFERGRDRVRLTPVGTALLPHGRLVPAEWDRAWTPAGKPPRIGDEIASAEETYEALVDGRGVCLLASGNAPLIVREGVVTRPVRDISPSWLALAWRATDCRPLVLDYVRACRQVTRII